jgi:hypothetical protein
MELLVRRGRIHSRSRVWMHGMSQWTRISQVPEFAFLQPLLEDRARQTGTELTPACGRVPPPVEGVTPTRPFANLLASHPGLQPPSLLPTMELSLPQVAVSTGGTDWFALSPLQMELLSDTPPAWEGQAHCASLATGVHLVRRPVRRVVHALLGLTMLGVVLLTLVALPSLMATPPAMMVRRPERFRASSSVVAPLESVSSWNQVLLLGGRSVPPKAPTQNVEPPAPNPLSGLKEAMGRSAMHLFGSQAQQ